VQRVGSSLSTVSETEDLRQGPDVSISWGPWVPGGGLLLFRNEGKDYAKNIRLQCAAESGWRLTLRPEVIDSLAPGAHVRVVDKGYGRSISQFVHSVPSKQLTMTLTFEDRLGVVLAKDFRVVAMGTHAQGGVIFHARALRKMGASDALSQSRARESHSPLHGQGEGHKKGLVGKKPVRRSAMYEMIDQALRDIAKALRENHEEVFRFLDGRKIATCRSPKMRPQA